MSNTHSLFWIRSRRCFAAVASAAVLLLAAGCGGGGDDGEPSVIVPPPPDNPAWKEVNPVAQQPLRKWTFLVYMNGANDLEEFGSLNLNQMEEIGSTDNVNLVVQFKRIPGRYDDSNGDWSGTRRYFVGKDTNRAQVTTAHISENGDIDMGKAASLQEFVRWGTAMFPAERYCLVLWNHGAGWRSAKLPKTRATRGFSYDDVTGSHIDTIELPAAININRKWDLIAFDSSLMQMAEVAYEIRDQGNYIVGSEESPPGAGYPYDRFLTSLNANPDMGGRDLAIRIADETITAYTSTDYASQWDFSRANDITQSVVDTSKIGAIAPAIDTLGSALLAAKGQYGAEIAQARDETESYAYPENRDLLHFCSLLTLIPVGSITPRVADTGVLNAVAGVRNVLGEAIIKNVAGRGHANSNGLAIFLTDPNDYRFVENEQISQQFGQPYGQLALTKAAPNWQRFLIEGPP